MVVLAGCGEGASTFSMPPSAATCTATLTWEPPYDRIDGTPITTQELEKYTIYINRRETVDTNTLIAIIEVRDTNMITLEVDKIPKGIKYFYMTVTDTEGRESTFSNILSQIC